MIDLFIIPCDDPEAARVERCIESFGPLVTSTRVLDHRNLHNITDIHSNWWCFMFSNEYIDLNLRVALTSHLLKDVKDYFVLYKKDILGRVFYAPRIFRKGIRLMEGTSMVPEHPEYLKAWHVFDGWLLG